MAWEDPTTTDLARSIGCSVTSIDRSVKNVLKSDLRSDGKDVWTSFVDEGDPEKLAVYETVWPQ